MSKGDEVEKAVYFALQLGYRHIDTADLYMNHERVGKALKRAIDDGIVERSEVFLVSKLWPTDYRADVVRPRVEKMLSDLQVDYLDQLLLHMPEAWDYPGKSDDYSRFFPTTSEGLPAVNASHDLVDTWRVLEELCEEGKGLRAERGWICYDYDATVPDLSMAYSDLAVAQRDVATERCRRYFEAAAKIFGPVNLELANLRHAVADTYDHDGPLPDVLNHPTIRALADRHGRSAAQVAIRWAIQRGTIVIPKSVDKRRIDENFDVLDFELSLDEMAFIDDIGRDPEDQIRAFTLPFAADGSSIFDKTMLTLVEEL
ncbi:hypothetical protein FOZ63_032383 [Perkinsus olseni]|nr:hypothetical protein FOZ63_032383 [Perkinsus olseni]